MTPDRGGYRRQRRPRPRRRPTLNFRYTPDRTSEEAEAYLRSLVPGRRRGRDQRRLAAGTRRRRRPARAGPARRGRPRASSPSRRGRTSPTSPRAGSTPSTSARRSPLRAPPRRAGRDRRRSCTAYETLLRFLAGPVSAAVRRSPDPAGTGTYPFVRLNEAAAARRAEGLEVIDFGMGDPREPTDPRIIQALRDGVRERMGYPAAVGLPELREAISGWAGRRFGVVARPGAHIVPTLGSKEAIFSFAQVVLDPAGGKDTVVLTEPGLPGLRARRAVRRCAGRAAAAARGERLPPRPRRRPGRRPGRAPRSSGSTTRTTRPARCAPLAFYERLAALARRARLRARLRRGVHGALVRRAAGIGAAAGRPHQRRRLQHPLEAIVDDRLPLGVRRRRPGADRGAASTSGPTIGTAPQEFVQRAVRRRLGRRGARRARPRRVRAQAGARARRARQRKGCASRAARRRCTSGSPSPPARRRRASPTACSSTASLVAPGSFLGPSGEGYVRFALVPPRRSARGPWRSWRMRSDGSCRSGSRSCSRPASRRPPPVEEAIRLLDARRGACRRAPRRRLGRQRVGEEGDPPLLQAAQGRADGRGRDPLPRQDPAEERLRRARCAGRPRRCRPLRRVPLPRASS